MPDSIQDFFRKCRGKAASSPEMTHLHREQFQRAWGLLLDDEFMQAYHHGMVVECADGVTRRVYPRIFTYSADYPEKYAASSMTILHVSDAA